MPIAVPKPMKPVVKGQPNAGAGRATGGAAGASGASEPAVVVRSRWRAPVHHHAPRARARARPGLSRVGSVPRGRGGGGYLRTFFSSTVRFPLFVRAGGQPSDARGCLITTSSSRLPRAVWYPKSEPSWKSSPGEMRRTLAPHI